MNIYEPSDNYDIILKKSTPIKESPKPKQIVRSISIDVYKIANTIKDKRKLLKMSLEQLARETKIDVNVLYRYENMTAYVKISELQQIDKVLGTKFGQPKDSYLVKERKFDKKSDKKSSNVITIGRNKKETNVPIINVKRKEWKEWKKL